MRLVSFPPVSEGEVDSGKRLDTTEAQQGLDQQHVAESAAQPSFGRQLSLLSSPPPATRTAASSSRPSFLHGSDNEEVENTLRPDHVGNDDGASKVTLEKAKPSESGNFLEEGKSGRPDEMYDSLDVDSKREGCEEQGVPKTRQDTVLQLMIEFNKTWRQHIQVARDEAREEAAARSLSSSEPSLPPDEESIINVDQCPQLSRQDFIPEGQKDDGEPMILRIPVPGFVPSKCDYSPQPPIFGEIEQEESNEDESPGGEVMQECQSSDITHYSQPSSVANTELRFGRNLQELSLKSKEGDKGNLEVKKKTQKGEKGEKEAEKRNNVTQPHENATSVFLTSTSDRMGSDEQPTEPATSSKNADLGWRPAQPRFGGRVRTPAKRPTKGENRFFACPFHKQDPEKYRTTLSSRQYQTCMYSSFRDIPDLR